MKEIERKFLVARPTESAHERLYEEVGGGLIEQGYFLCSEGVPNIRFRRDHYKNANFLTIKTPVGEGLLVREEFETEVSDEFFQKGYDLCSLKIEKWRYRLGRWELDAFEGPLDGLWILEIELESETEELPPFPEMIAPFVVAEVTNDARFYNEALARRTPEDGYPEL